jgi:hypothetical protein
LLLWRGVVMGALFAFAPLAGFLALLALAGLLRLPTP